MSRCQATLLTRSPAWPGPGPAGPGLRAGMPVELTVDAPAGTPRALPPGVDLAAYRVVQEALTNVMKHAGPVRTTVVLEYRPQDLLITVSDDGRRAIPRPPRRCRGRGKGWGRAGRPRTDRAAGTDRPVRRRAGRRPAPGRRLAGQGEDPAGSGGPATPVPPEFLAVVP